MAAALERFTLEPQQQDESRFTLYVVLACIVAASGGFIFGYDIGISGGVTSMDDFLHKFFPEVLAHRHNKNNYCQYDNQKLQLFTSSLYLAGLTSTFMAAYTTRQLGRRPSMLIAGAAFLTGATFNVAAENLAMLIVGRILLGIGVGFGNQAVPIYLSEIAPARLRGALNITFQLATDIGILVANLVNYRTGKLVPWGWRLSLGLALVPAMLFSLGGVFLPETPNSLVERGQLELGQATLQKLRGSTKVDDEFRDLVHASAKAAGMEKPFRRFLQRRYRPQLVITVLVPFFQQVTGINAIMFYAPVLFRTLGFTSDASLYSAVIVGGVLVLSTIFSILVVDKWGRKNLFYSGGVQMFICQVSIGLLLKYEFPVQGEMKKFISYIVLVLICIYVAGFGWSWGPLGWLVPSEISPLEIRSAAQSVTVSVNFLFTFGVGQALLSMLCHLQYGTFLFFAGWVLIMTVFVVFFLPETKGVQIDDIVQLFDSHWWWKKFTPSPSSGHELEHLPPNEAHHI